MKDSKKKYIEFESKKSLHFNITRQAHNDLRIACFKRSLSMQEVFEEIAQLVGEEAPVLMRILDNLAEKKREGKIKRLSVTDAEPLFNIIEKDNPLSEEE